MRVQPQFLSIFSNSSPCRGFAQKHRLFVQDHRPAQKPQMTADGFRRYSASFCPPNGTTPPIDGATTVWLHCFRSGGLNLPTISEWLDLETLKALSKHGTNVLACLFISFLIRLAILYTTGSQNDYQEVLLFGDDAANIGLVVWGLRELFTVLWNKRERFRLHVFVVA
jgi:hypothetical protein